ncbi:MAG: thioesterase family protein [Gammaproteobacteria bacterium]|jgi:acyl-CoA thioesterase FadM
MQPWAIEERRQTNDRRRRTIDYTRRKFDRRSREFIYNRSIHLSDTNSFGNVYYARFFDIFGEAREEFLLYILGDKFESFFQQDISIVTVEASCKYYSSLFLYNKVAVKLTVPVLKKMKFKMQFDVVIEDNNEPDANQPLIAKGEQWIGFTTTKGRPVPIPDQFSDNLRSRNLLLPT